MPKVIDITPYQKLKNSIRTTNPKKPTLKTLITTFFTPQKEKLEFLRKEIKPFFYELNHHRTFGAVDFHPSWYTKQDVAEALRYITQQKKLNRLYAERITQKNG